MSCANLIVSVSDAAFLESRHFPAAEVAKIFSLRGIELEWVSTRNFFPDSADLLAASNSSESRSK